jgi:hypothetical protein
VDQKLALENWEGGKFTLPGIEKCLNADHDEKDNGKCEIGDGGIRISKWSPVIKGCFYSGPIKLRAHSVGYF